MSYKITAHIFSFVICILNYQWISQYVTNSVNKAASKTKPYLHQVKSLTKMLGEKNNPVFVLIITQDQWHLKG